jgi:hypothetical protein
VTPPGFKLVLALAVLKSLQASNQDAIFIFILFYFVLISWFEPNKDNFYSIFLFIIFDDTQSDINTIFQIYSNPKSFVTFKHVSSFSSFVYECAFVNQLPRLGFRAWQTGEPVGRFVTKISFFTNQ